VSGPRLFLTFDDGPDPVWTPRVLDALAEIGAQATFFVIVPRAREHAEVVDRAVAEGHAIGFHCVEHEAHGQLSAEEGDREAREGAGWLRERFADGFVPLWRPPFGSAAPWQEEVAAAHGLAMKRWSADTGDWRGPSAEEMLDCVRPGLRDGAVVLMHDTNAEQTVRLLPMLAGVAGGFLRF